MTKDTGIISSFFHGTGISGILKDVSLVFLDMIKKQCGKNIFLCFTNTDDAFNFYCYTHDLGNNYFLYYPEINNEGVVPGFVSENDRYRKEAVLNLHNKKSKYICIGTKQSFFHKDLPINTSSLIKRLKIEKGKEVEQEHIINLLLGWNYEKADFIDKPNTYGRKGEILEIYPLHLKYPIRILFDYEKIERINFFDPITQKTKEELSKLTIKDVSSIAQVIDKTNLMSFFKTDILVKSSLRGQGYSFTLGSDSQTVETVSVAFESDNIKDRIKLIKRFFMNGYSIVLCGTPNSHHFYKGLNFEYTIKEIEIKESFILKGSRVFFVSLFDLFNKSIKRGKWELNKTRKDFSFNLTSISKLKKGDFVVHKVFGIGVFKGLSFSTTNSTRKEVFEIEYANNSKVSVSIDKLELVHRYVGSFKSPKVNSLGSIRWRNEVKKTRKALALIAGDLLKIYSKKENPRAFSFVKENDLDNLLKKSFPFIETKDQQKAIEDVYSDMNKLTPMDRLICGDVGFGKTEVALRAIFKCSLSSKQCLFLCPTTVLADQHYISCKTRLEPLGVKVALLSRFKKKSEQKKIINSLENGSVDVVVGTHRALSSDVSFYDLGLLVIDEEHRFGVTHKEKIRKVKENIDILTLTATPIPRTLQQSLVGFRSISLIQTHPKSRKPINTFIRYFNWSICFEYISRELQRNGQVFFLHNDTKTLELYKQKLKSQFPKHNIEAIHGKQPVKDIEKIILGFFNGLIDVLVCTTIIESGLDIPNANCIIVNNAHKFGLSQLYQIRGRVGRSEKQAYCLLFIPQIKIKSDAKVRLKSLQKLTSLGSGYDVSLKDLEIRGAGSLFGYKQSGHISSVGFEMYCNLLKEEISKISKVKQINPFRPTVDYYKDAFINKRYIIGKHERLIFYERLSKIKKREDLIRLKVETVDRYGKLLFETENLFFITEVALLFYGPLVKNIRIKKNLLQIDMTNHLDPVSFEKLLENISLFKDKNKFHVSYQNKNNNVFSISFFCKINIRIISNIATLFSDILKS